MKISIAASLLACVFCAVVASASPFQEKKEGLVYVQEQNVWSLNDKTFRAAPGLVVYDQNNRIIPPSEWPKTAVKVQYQLDLYGQLWRVWVLPEQSK